MSLRARSLLALSSLLVVAANPLPAQEAPVRLTPVTTLGCDFCETPEQFGVVTGLSIGGGRIVVADRDARTCASSAWTASSGAPSGRRARARVRCASR